MKFPLFLQLLKDWHCSNARNPRQQSALCLSTLDLRLAANEVVRLTAASLLLRLSRREMISASSFRVFAGCAKQAKSPKHQSTRARAICLLRAPEPSETCRTLSLLLVSAFLCLSAACLIVASALLPLDRSLKLRSAHRFAVTVSLWLWLWLWFSGSDSTPALGRLSVSRRLSLLACLALLVSSSAQHKHSTTQRSLC